MKKKKNNLFSLFLITVVITVVLILGIFQITQVSQTGQSKKVLEQEVKVPVTTDKDKIQVSLDQKDNYLANSSNIKFNDYLTLEEAIKENEINNEKLGLSEEKYNGYIVVIDATPILIKEKELREQKLDEKEIKLQLENYKQELQFKEQAVKTEISKTLNKEIKKIIISEFKGELISGFTLNISDFEAEQIKKLPNVKLVSPNYEVQADLYDTVDIIGASDVWQLNSNLSACGLINPIIPRDPNAQPVHITTPCLTGTGIKIAIVDTGVDYTHPDLGGCLGSDCKVIGGYDFVNNDPNPIDDMGHGTHCASIAAGNGALKGVAPDAKILAYKVLNSGGSGSSSDVIQGIERAVIDNADIISLSLGGDGNPDDPKSIVVDTAIDVGVVVVISAGNNGPNINTVKSPACARKAITVGSVNKQEQLANNSSRGPVIWYDNQNKINYLMKPDIVAPGVSICAAQYDSYHEENNCFDDGQHVFLSGTSMAAPHVAGAVALLKQKDFNLTPKEIKYILKSNARIVPETTMNNTGAGRLQILDAIRLSNPTIGLNIANYNLTGTISIIGTVIGNNFQNYQVYYKYYDSQDTDWALICEGNQEVSDSVLCEFDTTNLNDSIIEIKLQVNEHYDISVHNINNFEITEFGTNNYIKGRETIRGYINTPNYTSYKIEYHSSENYDWQELCSGESMVDRFCEFDFSDFSNDRYIFRLSVLNNGVWFPDKEINKAVINELADGWPLVSLGSPATSLLSTNLIGQQKIIQTIEGIDAPFYTKINIINNDASITEIDSVNINQNQTNFNIGYQNQRPAVINNNLMISGYYLATPSSVYFDSFSGIIDVSGNFQNVPYLSDIQIMTPTTIINNKSYYVGYSLFDTDNIKIYGFDIQGNTLTNFPIPLEESPRTGDFIYKIIKVKENGGNYIGVLYSNSFFDSTTHENTSKLYVTVYSEDGRMLNRTQLSEWHNSVYVWADLSAADFDNDGSTEMVAAFSEINQDMYDNAGGYQNPEYYRSTVNIVKLNGEIIEEPFTINGYLLNSNIAIGKFEGIPKIVFSLERTESTSDEQNKIEIIDYTGRDISEIRTDKVIKGISVGDIMGDSSTEIITEYESNSYDAPAGVLIYENENLIKNIEIPILSLSGGTEWIGQHDYPILTDFDGDGQLNIILQTQYVPHFGRSESQLFVFDTDYPYNPDAIDWTQDMYNERNTSCYKCD